MAEEINNQEDLLDMLDSLLREPAPFWDGFYADRGKNIPFFVDKPDENLVRYMDTGRVKAQKALELGSGPGRNAIFLAEQGCSIDAVDVSEQSIEWAKERTKEHGVKVNYIHGNIFKLEVEEGAYDLVYDSGCFHHISPHRRLDYINLVKRALKPGGYFAITCFVQEGELGGSGMSDWEVYRKRSLEGGLGFTEQRLRRIFYEFEEIEICRMKDAAKTDKVFGVSALWAALFQKR